MKRLLFAILFALALAVLTACVVQAQSPGCNGTLVYPYPGAPWSICVPNTAPHAPATSVYRLPTQAPPPTACPHGKSCGKGSSGKH